MTATSGFYGSSDATYYVAPSGRVWLVQDEDGASDDGPVETSALPEGVSPVGHMMGPDEAVSHLRAIEAECDEVLVETAE